MIRTTVTLEKEDLKKILAECFHANPDDVDIYYVETMIEDDIRATITIDHSNWGRKPK